MSLIETISSPQVSPQERLVALRSHAASASRSATGEVNNHIHTIYSFSPYTPAGAALKAWESGLEVAGSVDHDSIAAAVEMLESCAFLGMGSVVGFELRVSFRDGPFGKRKLNNPDSRGYAYMTVQGVPRDAIEEVDAFLTPVRIRRKDRTELMAAVLSEQLREAGLRELDFAKDVLGISKFDEGGGLTERHLLYAVAGIMIEQYGRGSTLTAALRDKFRISLPDRVAGWLEDGANPHYIYDLVGVLKSTILDRVYLQPDERECLPVKQVIEFARSIDAIPAYAYLGDVGESPTGDKKAEKFEDDFLEELFEELKGLGFQAVAYMPPRNTVPQLKRVQELCKRHALMEISGVDINSSRQSFNSPEVLQPEFRHLVDTTWALVAHQAMVSQKRSLGIFSPENPLVDLPLTERLAAYAVAGRALDPRRPTGSAMEAAKVLLKYQKKV